MHHTRKSLTKTGYSTVKSHFLRRKLITHSLICPLENRHHNSTDIQLYPEVSVEWLIILNSSQS